MGRRPHRLERIFQSYDAPLWFLTFNTRARSHLLANARVHNQFQRFCAEAAIRHIIVGRYVLMPDHVHLFVVGPPEFELSAWVRMLKLSLSKAIPSASPHWQEGFFDHLVRHSESYSEKWDYVRQNPVRAGLVGVAEEWPYQGEMAPLFFD